LNFNLWEVVLRWGCDEAIDLAWTDLGFVGEGGRRGCGRGGVWRDAGRDCGGGGGGEVGGEGVVGGANGACGWAGDEWVVTHGFSFAGVVKRDVSGFQPAGEGALRENVWSGFGAGEGKL